jgi:hypothetical protein
MQRGCPLSANAPFPRVQSCDLRKHPVTTVHVQVRPSVLIKIMLNRLSAKTVVCQQQNSSPTCLLPPCHHSPCGFGWGLVAKACSPWPRVGIRRHPGPRICNSRRRHTHLGRPARRHIIDRYGQGTPRGGGWKVGVAGGGGRDGRVAWAGFAAVLGLRRGSRPGDSRAGSGGAAWEGDDGLWRWSLWSSRQPGISR